MPLNGFGPTPDKYLVVHTERAGLAGCSFAQNLISKYRGFWKIGGSQGPIGFRSREWSKKWDELGYRHG